jgi:DNA-binding response OmpR family regulator
VTLTMARILLVEDEPGIALGLQDDLTIEGHQVEVVADGLLASARIARQEYDLLVLDVTLPGKDGFELCREVRRRGLTTPILMLTARAQEAEKILGFEMGADDYVTKPFGVRELRARIAALLRRAGAAAPPPTLRIGDVEVDFGRAEIRQGSAVVPLTSLEFKLLLVFARNRGRILSRDQLVNGAWGPGTFVSDRVVDNHIGNLRRKIESNPEEPQHLKNVRGLGYRFDA